MGGLVDIPLSRLTVARAGTATRVNSAGLLEAVAANAPRLDYDPVTLAPRGLLVEEARINRVAYSQQIDQWSDTLSNTTVTVNSATAPDGTVTADTLGSSATSGDRLRRLAMTIPNDGVTRAFSIFAKPGAGSKLNLSLGYSGGTSKTTFRTFDLLAGTSALSAGVNEGYGMEAWPGGWWRCWVALANNATGNTTLLADLRPYNHPTNTASGDVVVWGAQVEDGSAAPTSYIPTAGASVTRNADAISADIGKWFDTARGTLFVEARTAAWQPVGLTQGFACLHDGTANNRIWIERGAGTDIAVGAISAGGSLQEAAGFSVAGNSATFKAALAWESNNAAFAANGVVSAIDTSVIVPTSLTTLQIGAALPNPAWFANGWIRRLSYQPSRLSASELAALTA